MRIRLIDAAALVTGRQSNTSTGAARLGENGSDGIRLVTRAGFRDARWNMQNPENLYVYRVAKALVPGVDAFIDTLPPSERHNLASQMRRSATSIRNKIRDGCGRQGNRALLPFQYDSHASAGELEDQLDQSLEVNVGDLGQARRLRRRASAGPYPFL